MTQHTQPMASSANSLGGTIGQVSQWAQAIGNSAYGNAYKDACEANYEPRITTECPYTGFRFDHTSQMAADSWLRDRHAKFSPSRMLDYEAHKKDYERMTQQVVRSAFFGPAQLGVPAAATDTPDATILLLCEDELCQET